MITNHAFKLILAFILSFNVVVFDSKVPSLGNVASAQDSSQNETESYFKRPNIYEVKAQSHELTAAWPKIRKAHFHLVSLFLEMYPGTDLYFLARDSELLYDTAKLITKGTADEPRMHLLNISRLNMNDQNLLNYLAQEGVTEKSLASGRRAIFIDTGFAGSISRSVSALFSKAAAKNLKTHLIVSRNITHPSARSFLYYMDPVKALGDTAELHNQIVDYEHLPRYTDRSTQFIYMNGSYHPMSPATVGSIDGTVSKKEALKYMQDIKYFWNLETTPARVAEVRSYTRDLIHFLRNGNREEVISELKKRLSDKKGDGFLEVLLRDILDANDNMKLKIKFTLEDFNLVKVDSRNETVSGPLAKLSQKHPKLGNLLFDPGTELEELLETKNYTTIKEAVLASGKSTNPNVKELWSFIKVNIFNEVAEGDRRQLQLDLVDLMTPKQKIEVAYEADFAQDDLSKSGYLFHKLLDSGSPEVADALATSNLAGVVDKEWKSIVEKIILRSSQKGLEHLFEGIFAIEDGKRVPELFELAISRSTKATMGTALRSSFSEASSKAYRKALMQIIDRGDIGTLSLVFSHALSDSVAFSKDYEIFRYALSKVPDGKHNFLNIEYPSDIEKKLKIEKLLEISTRKGRIEFLNQLAVFNQTSKASSGPSKMCKSMHLQ